MCSCGSQSKPLSTRFASTCTEYLLKSHRRMLTKTRKNLRCFLEVAAKVQFQKMVGCSFIRWTGGRKAMSGWKAPFLPLRPQPPPPDYFRHQTYFYWPTKSLLMSQILLLPDGLLHRLPLPQKNVSFVFFIHDKYFDCWQHTYIEGIFFQMIMFCFLRQIYIVRVNLLLDMFSQGNVLLSQLLN